MSWLGENKKSPLHPGNRGQRYLVDPIALITAMIGGPLLATLAVIWVEGIPLAALAMGGPVYLVVGTPLLLWHLTHNPPSVVRISILALLSILAIALLVGLVSLAIGQEFIARLALFYAFFGALFAPVWAAATGWLYIRLRREAFNASTLS